MKKRVKIIGVILVVVLLAAYSVYIYLQPMAVETKTLALSESEISFIESGVVVSTGDYFVYPLVPGKVTTVVVQENERVQKGDVLATLDHGTMDYQILQLEKTIEGYRAQLAGAEVEYESTTDTLKANRSNLYGQLKTLNAEMKTEEQKELEALLIEQSKSTYERGQEDLAKYTELYDDGYISEAEYKDFEALVETYKTGYEQSLVASESTDDYFDGLRNSIYAQINSINLTLEKDMLSSTQAYYQSLIEASQASLEAMKLQVGDFTLTAPVDGVVADVMIDKVNMVTGMEPAFVIRGEGILEVEVKVNTRDIDVISIGEKVVLILDRRTGDIELEGEITEIENSASVEISPLGIEERKVLVTVIPESTEDLSIGYDLDVKFILFNSKDKIVVPNSTLYKRDEQDMVLVINDGTVEEVSVKLGYELTGETIIEEGLSEGDMLIIDLEAKGLSVGKKAISSNE
jgi:multidrug efflux pump subunit AcrA (membrane-fusion protein)